MKLFGSAILVAALLCAAPALAQSEMEQYQAGGDAMLAAQRETIQLNIDRATTALKADDFKTARKYAQSVTRADPKRIEAWLLLGSAQIGLQDWKAARGTYNTAVRMSPGDPAARAGLGVAMAKTHDPRATIQLAWLNEKVQACGTCGQAARLAKFKGEVETAIVQAPPKGS